MRLIALLFVVLLASCKTEQTFIVDTYAKEGIAFTATYREHSMTRDPNKPVRNAFQYASKAVKKAASEKGKELALIAFVGGEASYSMWSGFFDFQIEGRAVYGKEPFTGVPIQDSAGLEGQAYAGVARADRATAAIAGVGAGLSDYSRSVSQPNSGTQLLQHQQNTMQLQQMNSSLRSIDNNLKMMR